VELTGLTSMSRLEWATGVAGPVVKEKDVKYMMAWGWIRPFFWRGVNGFYDEQQ
jgi:hypothetical protein